MADSAESDVARTNWGVEGKDWGARDISKASAKLERTNQRNQLINRNWKAKYIERDWAAPPFIHWIDPTIKATNVKNYD